MDNVKLIELPSLNADDLNAKGYFIVLTHARKIIFW